MIMSGAANFENVQTKCVVLKKIDKETIAVKAIKKHVMHACKNSTKKNVYVNSRSKCNSKAFA